MRRRVFIAYVGGTIGMQRGPDGYRPVPGLLKQQMDRLPELHHASMPEWEIVEYRPLLDSACMRPADWWRIAIDIHARHAVCDGFVVLHGTDTMAFSASALSFLLEGLQKPVILTGSQIPLCELRTDARENLVTSVQMAATVGVPEVCLYFGDKLLRGCRAVKVDAEGFDAFASPNLPPLARVGVEIDVDRELVLRPPQERLWVPPFREARIGVLPLFPGVPAELVRRVVGGESGGLQGLVLEGYGVGNGPDDPEFLQALAEASARGTVIVDRTRCLRGGVKLGDYASSSGMARAGVVGASDMTLEATFAKLYVLLATGQPPEKIRQKMQQDLRGELSGPEEGGRRHRLQRIRV